MPTIDLKSGASTYSGIDVLSASCTPIPSAEPRVFVDGTSSDIATQSHFEIEIDLTPLNVYETTADATTYHDVTIFAQNTAKQIRSSTLTPLTNLLGSGVWIDVTASGAPTVQHTPRQVRIGLKLRTMSLYAIS